MRMMKVLPAVSYHYNVAYFRPEQTTSVSGVEVVSRLSAGSKFHQSEPGQVSFLPIQSFTWGCMLSSFITITAWGEKEQKLKEKWSCLQVNRKPADASAVCSTFMKIVAKVFI